MIFYWPSTFAFSLFKPALQSHLGKHLLAPVLAEYLQARPTWFSNFSSGNGRSNAENIR